MNEKLREEVAAIGIPPADQLSDVLIHRDKSVNPIINTATGAEGTTIRSVMRKGKPAVMLSTSLSYHGTIIKNTIGVFAVHLKKHDALVLLLCGFNRETFAWELQTRVTVTKNGEQEIEVIGENFYVSLIEMNSRAVDMTGQVSFFFDSLDDSALNTNIFNEVPKTLRSFTGGGVYYSSRTSRYSNFEGFAGLITFMKTFDPCYMNKDAKFGICELYMDNIQFEKKPLPENIKQTLREMAVKMLKDKKITLDFHNDIIFVNEKYGTEQFAYLQRCGDGNYVLRVFSAYIKQIQTDPEGVTLKYTETCRIGITTEMLSDLNLVSYALLGYDEEGIDDGIFKYTKNLLQDCVTLSESICKTHYSFDNAKNEFKGTVMVALYPFFEKLYNYAGSRGWDELQRRIIDIAHASSSIKNFKFSLNVGNVDETKKELHQILGVPKRILENMEFDETGEWFTRIGVVKNLFLNDKEYLMSMNAADIDNLCLFMRQQKMLNRETSNFHNLQNLITAYGGRNICGYINFLGSLDKKESCRYMSYTDKIVVVKQFVSTMDWKLKGEALEKADEAITAAYNIMNDQKEYKDMLKKYQDQFDEWKKYEFSDGNFFITFPTGPSSIVEEGIKLHHCVKEFIHIVANGETVILFIRKKDRPMKPFYTLEITGRRIRQVHGNDNCSIYENDGLKEFLTKFCNAKDIRVDFDDANRLLGPE